MKKMKMINYEVAKRLKELLEEAGEKWDQYIVDCQAEEMGPEVDYYQFLANHLMMNKVIELPCKVGDTVYRISKRYGVWEILPREVINMTSYLNYYGIVSWCIFTTVEDKLGETVFLTREEAQAALAERTEKK